MGLPYIFKVMSVCSDIYKDLYQVQFFFVTHIQKILKDFNVVSEKMSEKGCKMAIFES